MNTKEYSKEDSPEDNMEDLIEFRENIEEFLRVTQDARMLSQRDRDYKDNKQWTDQERAKLESRFQAAITVNRIHPKVEGMKGLVISRKTDPKAYPRTPKHQKAADAVTDGLRYVADNVDFDQIKLDVADNMIVEGYAAAIVEVIEKGKDVEITVNHIPWDRYCYDINSRRKDFKDRRWDGIILWMDIEHVKETFNLTDEEIQIIEDEDVSTEEYSDDTFEDRPMWVDKKQNRLRICQYFYIDDGLWKMCFFTANRFLLEPNASPYEDEYGIPCNPIEAQSANIDRDNNRFGEVRYWIDLQDEINHRRSKFLHLNSTRQTASKKGAIQDIPAFKREIAKANGHIEYNGEKGDFEVLGTGDMSEAQFLLYKDGKTELDAVGFNAQLSGERQGDLSGRAITNLQQASVNELSSFYQGLANWEKRIYRQMWMRIKQFWNEEKWIRVTDDKSQLRWVGFNQPITVGQFLQEQIQDESLDEMTRMKYAASLEGLTQTQDPQLQQVMETRNDIAELDVDIIIEISLDTINTQQEQFELLAKLAQTGGLTPEIIELSSLRQKVKDKLLTMMQQSQQAASQMAQEKQQIESQEIMARAAEKAASAEKKKQEAIQTSFQTNLLLTQPPKDSGVVI